jgi:hypothetical protein
MTDGSQQKNTRNNKQQTTKYTVSNKSNTEHTLSNRQRRTIEEQVQHEHP